VAKSNLVPALAVAVGVLAPHAATAATPLITGAATYELTLDEDSTAVGLMLGVSGTMTATMTQACETYRTEVDLAAELEGPGGGTLPMRMRSVEVEDAESLSFDLLGEFASIEIERAEGRASKTDESIVVSLAQPKSEQLRFGGDVLFPIAMLRQTMAAARTGERLIEFQTYDGSGYGRQVWRVSVLIAEADEADDIDEEGLFAAGLGFADMSRWRMKFSYFSREATGEMTPAFSTETIVYDNGFSQAAVYDFEQFAVRLKLVEFKPIPPEPCR